MKIIMTILIAISLYANIEVTQNIKALYRGVNLLKNQKNYIEENIDYNTNQLKKTLEKEIKQQNIKYLKDKNVISFILTPDNTVKKIKLLKKGDNHITDKITKKAILDISNKFIKPKQKIEIRFIVHFNIGAKQISYKNTKQDNKPYYKNISRGTTRFEYSSKEYVRAFETREDGFINLTIKPYACAEVRLLTNKNQKIYTGALPYNFNKEIPKGKYKLLIKVKKTCDISLQYL